MYSLSEDGRYSSFVFGGYKLRVYSKICVKVNGICL